MNTEYTLEFIRAVRKRISAQYDNNPRKLVAHYIELQKQYKARLLSPARTFVK
jgi:hypothetical protein